MQEVTHILKSVNMQAMARNGFQSNRKYFKMLCHKCLFSLTFQGTLQTNLLRGLTFPIRILFTHPLLFCWCLPSQISTPRKK